jgi:TolB-like protein/DNA-binding winged helix-turn-helix (wHTH) protein/Tfp pilus assembly protein PilF
VESDFHVGEWFVQPQVGTVTKGKQAIRLEPRVMDVLLYLVKHQGQVLPKDRILRHVWEDTFVADGVLIHAISELRKAFQDDPHDPSVIETLPKRGYRLIAPVVKTDRLQADGGALHRAKSPRRLVTWPALAVIFTGAAWWLFFQADTPSAAPGEITSLAVLPLADLSEEEEHEYFAAGMTDALISELGKISALRVISRQSVLKYEETDLSVPEIADELNVDAIIEGSVLQDGTRVRIAAQLIAAYPERHIWSQSYERDLSDILSLQSEMAQALATEIRAAVTPDEQERLTSGKTVHPEAYVAYLKGRYHWEKWTPEGVRKSTEYFQQAVTLDPNYAPAWAGLTFGYRFPSILGQAAGRAVLAKAQKAALRAVELDSFCAEAQATLGVNECYQWNWADCEKRILTALEINPSYAHGHHMYSNLNLAPQGRLDEALREIQQARDLAPLSLPHNAVLGKIHYLRRDHERAIGQLRETIDLNPTFAMAHLFIGKAYREKEMFEDAIEAHRMAVSLSQGNWALGELAYTYAVSGRRVEALNLLEEMRVKNKSGYVSAHAFALVHTGLDETELALESLEKAYRKGDLGLTWVKVDPVYDDFRENPRFKELLLRMNLEP